jgi:hypothetical protein
MAINLLSLSLLDTFLEGITQKPCTPLGPTNTVQAVRTLFAAPSFIGQALLLRFI